MSHHQIAVIVPCFNEALRIDISAFIEFAKTHDQFHFLFVNDGSTDQTVSILQKLHALNPDKLQFYSLPKNSGKAEAIRQGFLQIVDEGYAWIGYWDADLATPLSELLHFLKIIEQHPHLEVVTGARVSLIGRKIVRNILRHYVSRVFATFASQCLKLGVYDTQCGAKLFRVTPAIIRVFSKRFSVRWIFDVELLARIKQDLLSRQLRLEDVMYEVPLYRWDEIGNSKVRPKDFIRSGFDLYRIHKTYRF